MPGVGVEFAAGGGTRHTPTRSTVRRSKPSIRAVATTRCPSNGIRSRGRSMLRRALHEVGRGPDRDAGLILCRLHQAIRALLPSGASSRRQARRTHGASSSTRRPLTPLTRRRSRPRLSSADALISLREGHPASAKLPAKAAHDPATHGNDLALTNTKNGTIPNHRCALPQTHGGAGPTLAGAFVGCKVLPTSRTQP